MVWQLLKDFRELLFHSWFYKFCRCSDWLWAILYVDSNNIDTMLFSIICIMMILTTFLTAASLTILKAFLWLTWKSCECSPKINTSKKLFVQLSINVTHSPLRVYKTTCEKWIAQANLLLLMYSYSLYTCEHVQKYQQWWINNNDA